MNRLDESLRWDLLMIRLGIWKPSKIDTSKIELKHGNIKLKEHKKNGGGYGKGSN